MREGKQVPAGIAFAQVVAEVIESLGGDWGITHKAEEGVVELTLGCGQYLLRRRRERRTVYLPETLTLVEQTGKDELERILLEVLTPPSASQSP